MKRLTGLRKWLRLARRSSRPPTLRLPLRAIAFTAGRMRFEKLTVLDGRTFVKAAQPALESAAWAKAAEGLARIARGEQRLLTLCVSPTMRCAMACDCCYAKTHPIGDELNTRRWVELIAEAQDLGTFSIHYSGGEPCLREDLPEMIAATDPRSNSMLMTSGYGFPPMSARLRAAGLDTVVVSLDTFDVDAFNRRRGHVDAFGIALEAVRAALDEGFYTALGMLPEESMLAPEAFDAFVRRARDLGVHEVRVVAPRPSVPLGRHRSPRFDRDLLDRLRRFQAHYNRIASLPTVTSMDFTERTDNQGCCGGTTYAHITASGEVTPCTMSPLSFGNVRERPLAEVYAGMRRHYPVPLARCPLPEVWRLIRDVETEDLPVRDGDLVRRVTDRLRRDSRSPARFWRILGLRKEETT